MRDELRRFYGGDPNPVTPSEVAAVIHPRHTRRSARDIRETNREAKNAKHKPGKKPTTGFVQPI